MIPAWLISPVVAWPWLLVALSVGMMLGVLLARILAGAQEKLHGLDES